MTKSWNITYSNKEGFSLVVYTRSVNRVWSLLCDSLQWCIHHIFCFVPMPPFPIIHWNNMFCDKNLGLHFHFSWSWYGWSLGSFLCGYMCMIGDDYSERNIVYRHPLTEVELKKFYSVPSIKRFVEDIQHLSEDPKCQDQSVR